MPDARTPFLTDVVLKNYRSIAACEVRLGPLVFLVGPNGSGKSNFMDGLRLVAESLRTSLEHALHERGGIQQVRRRSGGHSTHFAIGLAGRLGGERWSYAFEVGAKAGGGFTVKREQCRVAEGEYSVHAGRVSTAGEVVMPPASPDRLYLVAASGLPAYRPLYDALSSMGFYNVQPERIRDLQIPDQGELLARDGSNLASVIRRMEASDEPTLRTVEEFLARVVPGVEGVEAKPVGHMTTVEFRQRVESAKDPWRFPAINMSDGTLRALAILVALFQPGVRAGVPLVGIEEPEVALHPAAAGILLDSLRAAGRHTQVVVTSHSPDLLEDEDLRVDELLAVAATDGRTEIALVDEASRTALAERLYTAGELLRANQLQPDRGSLPKAHQLHLFDPPGRQ